MLDDYQVGYNAYYAGHAYDESETSEWQDGWLDAEEEEGYSYEY